MAKREFKSQQSQDALVVVAPNSAADLFMKPSSKQVQGSMKTLLNNSNLAEANLYIAGTISGGNEDGPEEPDQGDRPRLEDIEIIEPPVAVIDKNGNLTWEYTIYVKNSSKSSIGVKWVDAERSKDGL